MCFLGVDTQRWGRGEQRRAGNGEEKTEEKGGENIGEGRRSETKMNCNEKEIPSSQ